MHRAEGVAPNRSWGGWRIVVAIWAAWLAFGFMLAPLLITRLHRGTGVTVLDRVLAGRSTVPIEAYLTDWRRLALIVSAVALLLTIWWVARRHVAMAARWVLQGRAELSSGAVILLAAWFGAVSGALEAIHVAVRHLFDPHPARGFRMDSLWMGPPASVVGFACLAAVLVIAARLLIAPARGWPRWSLARTTAALALLAAWGVLESPRWGLAWWAILLLAAGIASVVFRVASPDPRGFLRWTARSGLVLGAAVVGLLLFGAYSSPNRLERQRLAARPPAPPDAANVVLLILDTVRAEELELFGHARSTAPNLTAWASHGTTFEWAIAPSSWTLPSHASIFTGRHPHELSADHGVPLDARDSTLAEVLARRGYATAAFVANFAYTTKASGLARGFARYQDHPRSWGWFLLSAALPRRFALRWLPLDRRPWNGSRKQAPTTTSEFLTWLDRDSPRPFFAFLNYIDGHAPYLSSGKLRDRYNPDRLPVVLEKRKGITVEDLRGTRGAYDASIAYLDHELGRLLRELNRRGLRDSTVVIVTADHGEFMGEHGLQDHGNALYTQVLHVPLVIAFPGRVPAGVRIGAPVSLRDIATTVMDLAVGESTAPFPGSSLSRWWRDSLRAGAMVEPILAEVRRADWYQPWEPAFAGDMASMILDTLHFIRRGDGQTHLYRYLQDPGERHDVGPGEPALMARMNALMDSLRGTRARY